MGYDSTPQVSANPQDVGLVPKILPWKVSQCTSANPDSFLLMDSYPTTQRKKPHPKSRGNLYHLSKS